MCSQKYSYHLSENLGDDLEAEKVFQFQYHHFNQFLDWKSLLRCQEQKARVKTNYPFNLKRY